MRGQRARVIVVGGGIAGIATALRLAEWGLDVTLTERRPLLGGRASSFLVREDPETGNSPETAVLPDHVDNCQHVLMRCCTNLLDLYARLGTTQSIAFHREFSFVDREGRWSTLAASPWLPAPLHLIPSLIRFRSMSAADKLSICFAMGVLMLGREPGPNVTFGEWLAQMRQTPGAVECFWRPVVVSALNEEPDRTAAAYGFQLFRKAFLRSRTGFEMGLPEVELSDIYSSAGVSALEKLGVRVMTGAAVSRILIERGPNPARTIGVVASGETLTADLVVSAVPFHALPALLDETTRSEPPFAAISRFDSSPITGIHLWFDRPVADRAHVALLGREMQWIFSRPVASTAAFTNSVPSSGASHLGDESSKKGAAGDYLGLVVSASRDLTSRTQNEILAMAIEAVHEVFPLSREARLLRKLVIREPRATFSPAPGIEALRPLPRTPVQGLYLTGDWTRSGWPATMEGAARSGYLTAEAVLADLGTSLSLVCQDLPPDRLPRLLGL